MSNEQDKKNQNIESTELTDTDLDKVAGGLGVLIGQSDASLVQGRPIKVNEAQEQASGSGGGGGGGGSGAGGRTP